MYCNVMFCFITLYMYVCIAAQCNAMQYNIAGVPSKLNPIICFFFLIWHCVSTTWSVIVKTVHSCGIGFTTQDSFLFWEMLLLVCFSAATSQRIGRSCWKYHSQRMCKTQAANTTGVPTLLQCPRATRTITNWGYHQPILVLLRPGLLSSTEPNRLDSQF